MLSHHPLQMLMTEATDLLDAKKLPKRQTVDAVRDLMTQV